MNYHEHIVKRIALLEDCIKRRRYPLELARKLRAILNCLEYQVEGGECPAPVVRSLQAAMQSWINIADDSVIPDRELAECVDEILRTLHAEPDATV